VVRRPGLDERLMALSLATGLLLCRVCCVVFCACGVPPPEALWRVVGVGVCVEDRRPFWAFQDTRSLGIGEALFLRLWVCLWLSWRRMGWRQTGCFCITTVACVLSQPQNPLTGWTALFFGAPWLLHGVSLKGAEVVTAASRPGAPRD
jgi:hypothetical protein